MMNTFIHSQQKNENENEKEKLVHHSIKIHIHFLCFRKRKNVEVSYIVKRKSFNIVITFLLFSLTSCIKRFKFTFRPEFIKKMYYVIYAVECQ